MRLGTDTASLANYIMGGSKQPEPKVGDPATIIMWTDRHACTVERVTPSMVVVRHDRAIRTDSNGHSDQQEYRYERDPNGGLVRFRRTRQGWREEGKRGRGSALAIGTRDHYYDYSF